LDWKIPLFKIYWDKEDITAVQNIISSGMNWATGPEVSRFEEEIARYIGVKYCLTFNSGTSALHALLLAHGIGKGDEVIVPSFTFIATANAALFVGARPVFADIEEKTLGLNPQDVARKITPKTRAIIPIHYGGCPCRIEELKDLADKHKILLIEDAAESFGASVNGKKTGTIGSSAILSFCQNKVITTGEGGAVLTGSDTLYKKLKLIRSQGRQETNDYFSTTAYMDYVTLGYNFRMSNITAALGLAQLGKVENIIKMRIDKAEQMNKRLAKVPEIITPVPPIGYHHVYQMYCIRLPENKRDRLIEHLAGKGIMSKVNFYPVHKTSFYTQELKYDCTLPMTEKVSRQILSLPIYPQLSTEEINSITGQVIEFCMKK